MEWTRDVSVLDEPHKARTNAGVAVEVDLRNSGLGPEILGPMCGRNAGRRQVQRQSHPVWASQDFWMLAGAVGPWLCKTAAGRSVADGRAVRATESRPAWEVVGGCAKLHAGAAREPSRPA